MLIFFGKNELNFERSVNDGCFIMFIYRKAPGIHPGAVGTPQDSHERELFYFNNNSSFAFVFGP
ncbi:hypothetical protein BGLY_1354 [Bacillus glycinifermentans]|nr:hypothetical protein BGLY_1354 [Bacillus glycinifermentans]